MIRFATEADKNRIIDLWTEIFGDSREAVMQFLDYFPCEWALGYYADDALVSFMFLLPIEINRCGEKVKANYVYALCTDPQYRSKGYANSLIKYSMDYSAENDIGYTLIRPSSESLFDYYSTLGFEREYRRVKKSLTNGTDLLYNQLDNDVVTFAEWGSNGVSYASGLGITDDTYLPCVNDAQGERYLMIRRNTRGVELPECVYMGLTFE